MTILLLSRVTRPSRSDVCLPGGPARPAGRYRRKPVGSAAGNLSCGGFRGGAPLGPDSDEVMTTMARVVVIGDLMTDAVAHATLPLARGSDTPWKAAWSFFDKGEPAAEEWVAD